MRFELEERVERFGESVIHLAKTIKITIISKPIIEQLIRSATSIGANYFEANAASSKKDFINKIYICKKESKETQHWLRMLSCTDEKTKPKAREFYTEARELSMIFSSIITKTKGK